MRELVVPVCAKPFHRYYEHSGYQILLNRHYRGSTENIRQEVDRRSRWTDDCCVCMIKCCESAHQDGNLLFHFRARLMRLTIHSPGTFDQHTLLRIVDAAQEDIRGKAETRRTVDTTPPAL